MLTVHFMRTWKILILLLYVVAGPVAAQTRTGLAPTLAASENAGVLKIHYGNRNEAARAIEFREQSVSAATFIAGINKYLQIPNTFTFVEKESGVDRLGMRHLVLQQHYNGIPMEGLEYRVHEKNGFITSANGKAVKSVKLETSATLSESAAFHLALTYLNTKDSVTRPGRKLIVSKGFAFTPESFAVAFQFDIDVSLVERWRISIDARSGQVVNKVSLVHSCHGEDPQRLPYSTGSGRTNYYGVQPLQVEELGSGYWRLEGETEHGGLIRTLSFDNKPLIALIFGLGTGSDFYSTDNVFDSDYQRPGASVQWAAEKAYEYYFNKHGRNSFDNAGATIESYVHVDNDLDNAFWTGTRLAFGDGSNNNPLVELDVVGHELTHAVTQYEAQLNYYGEPGALNESFSDVLGKAIEFDTFGDTATWQLAKYFRAGGLRDLSDPNLKDQPDTYNGQLWYTGYGDNGGVHYNSGVQNFWFYLLCEGGTGVNDHEFSYEVKSIGIDRAANIAYRNLTEYLGYSSDYFDSRVGSLLATADLYGRDSDIYQQVENAWDAVGVIDEPIITNMELYDITATTVKIRGSLLPRGQTVTYRFEYGLTTELGSTSATYNYTDKIEATLTGLQSNSKYYLRLVATNENGSSYATKEFTTLLLTPLTKLTQTADVTLTTASLYGMVNPNSLPTTVYFEYGQTPTFGQVTPPVQLSDATEFLNVSADISGLDPRQTYYYRLVATNSFASSTTESLSFFTAEKPVITAILPTEGDVGTDVTITGINFNPVSTKNVISFGATQASIIAASPNEIQVRVPAGASLGPISIVDIESGLIGNSVQEFNPTFSDTFTSTDIHLTFGNNDNISKAFVKDMDGDGKPDLVARTNPGFFVYQNVNQGGDITAESFVRNAFPFEIYGLIYLADMDGNGLDDIVTFFENGIQIYPNLSAPGFVFFGPPVDLAGIYLSNFVLGDFDHDGRIDFCGTQSHQDASYLEVFRNENAGGKLSAGNFVHRYSAAMPFWVYNLIASDLTNDGLPDLLAGGYEAGSLALLKNVSQGRTFSFEVHITTTDAIGMYSEFFCSDLNDDGWQEVIVRSLYEAGRMTIFRVDPETTDLIAFPTSSLTDTEDRMAKIGDLDGNGKPDLLIGHENRRFTFLKNNTPNGDISNLTFDNFAQYGIPTEDANGTTYMEMSINDLNGDGRPEIINSISYNYYPHDGYTMEIWQNSPNTCIDPALVTVAVGYNQATIVLPPNSTFDDFEIQIRDIDYGYWQTANSTSLYLYNGRRYEVRVRTRCYLQFTQYHYIQINTPCVDLSSFTVSDIGLTEVSLSANGLSDFEIQYKVADSDVWHQVYQYATKIENLVPGTTYDLRYRGRCGYEAPFDYIQFSTKCPNLTSLSATSVTYNTAVIEWTNMYEGTALLEYSTDLVNWTVIDESGKIVDLTPGKKHYVRGSMVCSTNQSDYITTSFNTPCPVVSGLQTDVTPFSATVNWVDESATHEYLVRLSGVTVDELLELQTRATGIILNELTPGTFYTVSVAPACAGTPDFITLSFTTSCYAPFDPVASDVTPTAAHLSWSDDFGAQRYKIDFAIAGTNKWSTIESDTKNTVLENLRPGTLYEARIHLGCPDTTPEYAFVSFTTSLYGEMSFGPSPTSGKVTILPDKSLIGRNFSVLDPVGRQVIHGQLLDYTIDLSEFAAGIYTVRVEGEVPMRVAKQ